MKSTKNKRQTSLREALKYWQERDRHSTATIKALSARAERAERQLVDIQKLAKIRTCLDE